MKEQAKSIILTDIDTFCINYSKEAANFAYNLILGKIAGFVELQLLTGNEMNLYIDLLTKELDKI